jgi:hypothetical protein
MNIEADEIHVTKNKDGSFKVVLIYNKESKEVVTVHRANVKFQIEAMTGGENNSEIFNFTHQDQSDNLY